MGAFAATGKISKVTITQAGAGTLSIASLVAGQSLRLISLEGSMTGTGTIKFQSISAGSVATDKSGPINLIAGTPLVMPTSEEGYVSSNSGEGLQFVTTGGGFNGSAVVQQIMG